jgi:hypothetical protein
VARRLRLDGHSQKEIADYLGLAPAELRELTVRGRRFGEDDLHPDSWRAFILTLLEVDETERYTIAGRPVSDDASARALFRFAREASAPTIWSADRFLCRFDIHIDSYFRWCEEQGREAWAVGEPAWHRGS